MQRILKGLRKKTLAMLLVTGLAVSAVGCGSEKTTESGNATTATSEAGSTEQTTTKWSAEPYTGKKATEQSTENVDKEAIKIPANFTTADEGKKILSGHDEYFGKMNARDVRARGKSADVTQDQLKEKVIASVGDFTDKEKTLLQNSLDRLSLKMYSYGFTWPRSLTVNFVRSKMDEEVRTSGYTLGNDYIISAVTLDYITAAVDVEENETAEIRQYIDTIIAEQLFHILSRNYPEFKKAMYDILGFTITEEEPAFTDEVKAQLYLNPNIDGYKSYAEFTVDGKKQKAVIVAYSDAEEPEKAEYNELVKSGIVLLDSPDKIIANADVSDFIDVIGRNAGRSISIEDCLAMNFSYALVYGTMQNYNSPEIIHGILNALADLKTF